MFLSFQIILTFPTAAIVRDDLDIISILKHYSLTIEPGYLILLANLYINLKVRGFQMSTVSILGIVEQIHELILVKLITKPLAVFWYTLDLWFIIQRMSDNLIAKMFECWRVIISSGYNQLDLRDFQRTIQIIEGVLVSYITDCYNIDQTTVDTGGDSFLLERENMIQ